MTGDILPSPSSSRSLKSGNTHIEMDSEAATSSFAPQMWTLLLLADQSILASGDSRGQLQLWDVALGVLLCSFKQHLGDVLALSASIDGERVFSAGLDGKVSSWIVCYVTSCQDELQLADCSGVLCGEGGTRRMGAHIRPPRPHSRYTRAGREGLDASVRWSGHQAVHLLHPQGLRAGSIQLV